MVNFTHYEAGTDESHWQESDRLASAARWQLPAGARLTVLAAHPDDETLAVGGLMATIAGRGGSVTVFVASDGENSHPASREWTPARLARTRRRELSEAMAALGDGITVRWLGRPDGSLATYEEEISREISGLLAPPSDQPDQAAGTHLIATTWRHDGHPDHEAIGRIGAELARRDRATLLELPIWFWHWGTEAAGQVPWEKLHRFELDAVAHTRKAQAMDEHRSQVRPLSPAPGDEAILPPAMVAHFERTFETFIVTEPGR